MYYFTGCWIFNLKCVCIYELSFWLQSFVCYLIVDINHMTSFPLFDSLFSCASQTFSLSCTEVFIKSNLSYSYILPVGNTPLVLFWTSPVCLQVHLTSSHRCSLCVFQTCPSSYFLTCSVKGTSIGYNDRGTDFDWMIKSITCFLWHISLMPWNRGWLVCTL